MTMPWRAVYLLALANWLVFLIAAVTLGALREGLIAPALGEQAAHVIGTLLFVAAMLAIQWAFVLVGLSFPNGRLISILNFDFGPTSFFARMSFSVNLAKRISPSVARLRS